ncbi:MAG: transposase [Deltaproteobacteria bacterium]|nr:transposase [Deltaproteobacteria bacterium]
MNLGKKWRKCCNHHELILNWFRAKGEISNGIVEGLNGKAFYQSRNIDVRDTVSIR